MTKGANAVITGRDTCTLNGREYRAVPARRGCDGCAAMPGHLSFGRDIELCSALPPCDTHGRGGGGDIIWVTRGGRPRARCEQQGIAGNRQGEPTNGRE